MNLVIFRPFNFFFEIAYTWWSLASLWRIKTKLDMVGDVEDCLSRICLLIFVSSFITFLSALKKMRSRKWLGRPEAKADILVDGSACKINLLDDVQVLLPVKIHQIPFIGWRKRENMYQPIRGKGGPFCWRIGTNDSLGKGHLVFPSFKVLSYSFKQLQKIIV